MTKKWVGSVIVGLASLAFTADAFAHDIPWPRGASRQMGFGSCAKGPCMHRTSFAPSVPHEHVAPGKCKGLGAAGYTFGRHFDCALLR